ncbi:MAG: TraR/DksA family transcriptional regulator [Pseudomonadota bacterium]
MVVVCDQKAQLEGRLTELTGRLRRIEGELDTPASKDFAESATEREAVEVLEDLGIAGQREIRMIKAALDRIDDGSYGYCVACGEPIPEARLRILPQTPLCAACAGRN